MTVIKDVKVTQQHILNQQLFSNAYLQELRTDFSSNENIRASYQTIAEWRESYSDLYISNALQRYVGQCLSALDLTYTLQSHGFLIFSDETPVAICLMVHDTNLGRTTKGNHHQANLVKYAREQSLQWGILTNGKRWRLCYAAAAAPYEVYLEIDLDALLEQEVNLPDFALFYKLFGQRAFTLQKRDIDVSKKVYKIGLDWHMRESEKRVEAIQRYLRTKVEHVLQKLCLGFVEDTAAGTYIREMLDEIYRNAIYLLYRILFVFYAESRELLPIRHPDYQRISLASILEDAYSYQTGKHFSDNHTLWTRLGDLFGIVDKGNDALGISPYNGGLFDDDKKPYLKDHRIANSYLAPALFNLGYQQEKDRTNPIDYADLSVRHLGTLYEGLLEYRLNLVEQEPIVIRGDEKKRSYIPLSEAKPVKRFDTILEVGEAYFADYKGERKSSGSYYTPEDVVQYIVSNTLLSKLQERFAPFKEFLASKRADLVVALNSVEQRRIEYYIDDELEKFVKNNILSIRILDPAMGSAHFLVAAGQHLTNFIVEALNITDWPNERINSDALRWKRRVVERCLYGVDINPLAQELAKLALWLASTSQDKPLTFLDHHLKTGNSLYGTPLNQLDQLPTIKKESKQNLFQQLYAQTLQDTVGRLNYITGTDSDDIKEVKRKGDLHKSIETRLEPLRDVANIWLASLFELKNSIQKPINQDDYFRYLQKASLYDNDTDQDWKTYVQTDSILLAAREVAEQNHFFHWEIEFPDAVPDLTVDGHCQFDVIIANPPYVGKTPNKAISTLYKTARCGDIYAWLFEISLRFTGETGDIGMIVPLSLMFSRDMKSLRTLLLEVMANTYVAAFDATRDGIFQPSGESRNAQRASIVLHSKDVNKRRICTTNLIRWISEERSQLLSKLVYTDITIFATSEMLPKLGDPRLVEFFGRIRNNSRKIGTTLYRPKKELKEENDLPPPILYYAYVPRTARYFITAMPISMRNTGVNVFTWEDQWTRDLAILTLNSNVFYWLWCVLGDGFDVTGEVISAMFLPDVPKGDKEAQHLYNKLINAAQECVTYHKKWGEQIPNYNFNKRMDILIEIDKWIIRQVAPDMELPQDIFAQYKSNSFLRPLDLSEILNSEEQTEEAE